MIDGVDHINVYSKGDTELGRLLSNFAHTPFTGGGRQFASVEGWWHWYCTGKKLHHLAGLYGFRAKQEGRKYKRIQVPNRKVLLPVYKRKIECNDYIHEMLVESTLPFTHYFNYGDKIVQTEWEWTGSLWNEVREYFKSIQGGL